MAAVTYEQACGLAAELHCQVFKTEAPRVTPQGPLSADVPPAGPIHLAALPLEPMAGARAGTEFSIYFDWVDDVVQDWEQEAVKALMLQRKFDELPAPLSPAQAISHEYTMSLFLLPAAAHDAATCSRKVQVLKMFHFQKKAKYGDVKGMCRGTQMKAAWGGHAKRGSHAFRYMLDRMGGIQYSFWQFTEEPPQKQRTAEQVDKFYDHIDQHAPRTNGRKNEQARWVQKELLDTASPIHGWDKVTIREALANLKTASVTAKTVTAKEACPLTLKSISCWFLADVLVPILRVLFCNTLMLLGVRGRGKSPVAKILALLASEYHITEDGLDAEPQFRTANHFDLLRGEPV